ncbi:hypothetical protein SDC9_110228 [bioreactor metagenome]|uniref:Uncharacterized protein n=1 Tax=bioreactor metagenome TaxID=1076179 RepID=A0A645BE68_9ZZZZ
MMRFKHRDRVTAAGEPVGRRQPRRTAADHRDRTARGFGPCRNHPIAGEGMFDHRLFQLPDHHRFLVESVNAGTFAQRRTDPRREFRKGRSRTQDIPRFAPFAAGDRGIDIGDAVVQRTAGTVTEGNAAVHAALGLFMQFGIAQTPFDFVEVAQPLRRRAVELVDAFRHFHFSLS